MAILHFIVFYLTLSPKSTYKMYSDDTRKKLQDIISGTNITWQADTCTAARNYLCTSFSPSTTVKRDFDRRSAIKKEQAQSLIEFITLNHLWRDAAPYENRYLTQGGEAEIYFDTETNSVIKLNDAVYYSTWLDFFTSILIHNLLFGDTYYQLEGFVRTENRLQAMLKQKFAVSNEVVDLTEVKIFLELNGFINTKRDDYYNPELGLILEDIHDQNVIMNSGVMFFIDTVFYIDLK